MVREISRFVENLIFMLILKLQKLLLTEWNVQYALFPGKRAEIPILHGYALQLTSIEYNQRCCNIVISAKYDIIFFMQNYIYRTGEKMYLEKSTVHK